jgi:predicted ATPase
LLDEAVDIIDRTDHRMYEAEVHRVLGELHLQGLTPDLDAARTSFLKSLAVARAQDAKGWELRAATSLARLWESQGKRREAYELLAPVYNWFTEGLDTHDLKQAKALLEELG